MGVEVGEKFNVKGNNYLYEIKNGCVVTNSLDEDWPMNGKTLCNIINDLSMIIRNQQFTPDEKAVLRLLRSAGFVKLILCDESICAKKIHEERTYFTKDLLPSYKMDYEIYLDKIDLE